MRSIAVSSPNCRALATALAEYADTSVFIPELDDRGHVVPPGNFGLELAASEEPDEEITSSEGDEEEEGSNEETRSQEADPAASRQPDQSSTSGKGVMAPPAAGDG